MYHLVCILWEDKYSEKQRTRRCFSTWRLVKRIVTKFKVMTFACQQVSVSSVKATWPFHTKPRSPLREKWKRWRNCKRKKNISFKIMNSVSMVAAQRHLILNNMISSKVFSKSQSIYISKGEKLLSFHSLGIPPTPAPLLKVTFISESVFLRVYL